MSPDDSHEARTAGGARRLTSDELAPLLYEELRRMAAAHFRREDPGQTLQPTALVHEAYVRLADQKLEGWEDRSQFLAIAARSMRRVLVDAGRARKADKRGGGLDRVTFVDSAHSEWSLEVDVLDLDRALERLAAIRPRSLEIVELRFFAGLSLEETAQVLGVTKSAVAKEWARARAYVAKFLDEDSSRPSA